MRQYGWGVIIILLVLLSPTVANAQRSDVPEYGQRGAYAVGTFEFTIDDDTNNRPLNGTIWYPADAIAGAEPEVSYNIALIFGVQGFAYRDAQPNLADGPYPLIVYTHGSFGSRVYSLWLTEHLASQGFIVMAVDHPDNSLATNLTRPQNQARSFALRTNEISRQLDYAELLNASGTMAGMFDLENIGVTGYSLGAVNTLEIAGARLNFDRLETFCDEQTTPSEENVCQTRSYASQIASMRGLQHMPSGNWASQADPRVDAIAIYAPWNGVGIDVSTVNVPTFIAVGTNDDVAIPERDAYNIFDNLTTTRYMTSLELGGHVLFVDECAPVHDVYEIWDACTDPVWDLERAHDILNHATTAFFLTHLTGQTEAEDILINYDAVGVEVAYQSERSPLSTILRASKSAIRESTIE
ncbi:MAG: hypothetical protein AAFR81_09570 [Chloroflexota bacterium]